MINREVLLSDLQKLLRQLETDLRQRCDEVPEIDQSLRADYDAAREAGRTGDSFEQWRADTITQTAAAWVLTCVFARFLEDNRLVDPPKLSGPGERLRRARDEHELYFHASPKHTDREYLLSVFADLAKLPGCAELFASGKLSLVTGHSSLASGPNTNDQGQMTNDSIHWLSADAARALLTFFQRIEPESGNLAHDFTDPQWDTRFLGDLYQDLSEAARKKYALLQTPEFVEEFILDRTLDPAIEEFGLDGFRMIDPACGSGHFLLGSFRRLAERWRQAEPATNDRELVQRALDSVHGVDLNPYAVAIARFRLLLAAMRACGVERLADAPSFRMNLVCGDSLLHGSAGGDQMVLGFHELAHAYQSEDLPELRRILRPGTYHAVVANPPYITPKDRSLNAAYRERYPVCHMNYSLAVPFMQRIFSLAVVGGYSGQITANSFMKREFGKKLIEQFLPTVDLTHVIDTSGAYIPGHGTPTVILLGRNGEPVTNTIRTVMGIRGEPSTPDDPSRGIVWSAIITQIDQPGSQSEFVSVSDSPRVAFHTHPWSIGGGGAAELKEQLDSTSSKRLGDFSQSIGITSFTLEDEIFILDRTVVRRHGIASHAVRPMVTGDDVRDWGLGDCQVAVFPYDGEFAPITETPSSPVFRHLWIARASMSQGRLFGGKTKVDVGLRWYEYGRLTSEKLRTPFSIAFPCVATHNHFILDRGGQIFNRHAPIVKLRPESSEDDHLAILGLLNSSTACFWMKQVFFPKGGDHVGQEGARVRRTWWDERYEFAGTGLQQFPLPAERPLALAQHLDSLARAWSNHSPSSVLTAWSRAVVDEQRVEAASGESLFERSVMDDDLDLVLSVRDRLKLAHKAWETLRAEMIALQEELDWQCYRLYGLTEEDLTQRRKDAKPEEEPDELCVFAPLREFFPVALGQRAFEIVMARKMAVGELQTTWFERHGSTPTTEIPADWPDDYRRLVERRIEAIESNPQIALVEQPEYKRRWNTEPWDSQLERALREWLLGRLESYFDFDGRMSLVTGHSSSVTGHSSLVIRDAANDKGQMTNDRLPPLADIQLVSVSRLSDIAARDADFMQVAELYRGRQDFDIGRLVAELVADESVPLLPVLRYKPSGLDKRHAWERTWELQREEDRRASLVTGHSSLVTGPETNDQGPMTNDKLEIPVPPKYTSADFQKSSYWRLRGKLDVPKERWVSFPHCEGEDGTLVIAWAGLDHLQLARAVSGYLVEVQDKGGSTDPRLVPLLGGILELVPWLKQWHNDPDPEFDNMRMGDYFESFVEQEARTLGLTVAAVRAWQPPKKGSRKGAKTQRGK